MKHIKLFGLFVLLASFTVSCANRNKTASANNPYQSNPYYSDSGSSSTASSSDVGSASYPTYSDDTYTAPASPNVTASTPPIPPVQDYPSYPNSSSSDSYSNSGNYNYNDTQTYTEPNYGSSASSSHVVAAGENLYRISLRYGTSVSAIQAANGMSDTTIYPGQKLIIP